MNDALSFNLKNWPEFSDEKLATFKNNTQIQSLTV